MPEESSNKRIAKNALFLYLRTIVTTIVGIYTSRVILQILGVEDYGVYNVAGGVVGMLAFINGSMYGATTRYITFELGRGNEKRLHDTFSSTFFIHLLVALLVLLIAETVGLWFLNNKLVIPEERYIAAQWVYHLSILAAMIDITQTPYNACMTAHERFDISAYVQMFSTLAKLGILFIVAYLPYDHLIAYALLFFVISCCSLLFIRFFCLRNYKESRLQFYFDKQLLSPMIRFFGWEVIGGIGRVSRVTGVNMVINIFHGVLVNAAVGIGNTVSGAVNGLAYNVVAAFQPNITKCYARGNISAFEQSIIRASSLSFMLFAFFAIPFIVECRYVLNTWLDVVPAYSAEICAIHLFFNCFFMIDAVVSHALKAMNKNMGQNITVGITGVLTIILVYLSLFFQQGILTAIIIYDAMILVTLGYNMFLLFQHMREGFVWDFLKRSFLRVVFLMFLSLFLIYTISSIFEPSWVRFLLTGSLSSIVLTLEIFFIILDSRERNYLLSYCFNKLHLNIKI